MYTTNETMAERLTSAQAALSNALTDEFVKNSVSRLGFNETRLNEGLALHQKVEGFYLKQKQEYSRQCLTFEELKKTWNEAQVVFKEYTRVAKLSLMDESDATLKGSLGLNGGRKFVFSEWIAAARAFYTTALETPVVLKKLADYAVTPDQLQNALQMVATVEQLKARWDIEKATAQLTTNNRNSAFKELDRYMYRFRNVARLAIGLRSDHLGKIGIAKRAVAVRKRKTPVVVPDTHPPQPALNS